MEIISQSYLSWNFFTRSQLVGVVSVVGSKHSFVAILQTGTIVAWGAIKLSKTNLQPPSDLNNVVAVTANDHAFAALTSDGAVVAFGHPETGGDVTHSSSAIRQFLSSGVTNVVANYAAFVALKQDGTIATWGKVCY